MKRRLLIPSVVIFSCLTGCAGFSTGRSFLTESNDSYSSSFFDPREDFPVMAGDSGELGRSEEYFSDHQPKTREEMERDRTTMILERELAQLQNEQSESNAELYNLHKHKFKSTSEKIFFLKLPQSERRDFLVAKGIMKEPKHPQLAPFLKQAIRHSDVMMGMSKDDVVDSWGRPSRVEVAGNPSYENERWAYNVNGATKYIYFESGKVDGWE